MVVLTAGLGTPGYTSSATRRQDANLRLVFDVPSGSAEGAIGVLPYIQGDVPNGPQAIAAADGRLYVADSVGRRVVVWDGGAVSAIDVPYVHYARDLVVSGGDIFILDVSDRIFVVGPDGDLKRVVDLPAGMSHLNVLRLVAAQDGSGEVLLWCSNYIQFSLSDLPGEVDPALWGKEGLSVAGVTTSTVDSGARGPVSEAARSVCLDDQNLMTLLDGHRAAKARVVPVGGGIGSARLIGFDGRGWAYVLVEELGVPNPGVQVELSLRVFNEAGSMVKSMRLPLEDMAAVPWQPVAVTPEGEVYVLAPGAERVSVYRAVLGNGYVSRLTHQVRAGGETSVAEPDVGIETVYYGKFKGYPISQTRAGVRTRSLQMVNYSWTWHKTYDKLSTGTTRSTVSAYLPDHMRVTSTDLYTSVAEGTALHGIPYSWGGWDSPWTYSDNRQWTSFGDALTKYYPNNGPLVGNVNYDNPWISGTAGIDCAGFVAAASDTYYIGTVGTDECYKPGCYNLLTDGKTVTNATTPGSTSPNYTYYSGMQPMSFFINTGHVLNYNYRLLDGSGMATLESTLGGYEDGAKAYSRTWSDLLNYQCKTWWDRVTGEDFTVPYTTKTGKTIIQGSQIYYKFQAASSSTTITVTASSGDPDLYVYDSSYGYLTKSTLAGSDTVTLSTTVGAYYYVKVHAWSDCTYTINW